MAAYQVRYHDLFEDPGQIIGKKYIHIRDILHMSVERVYLQFSRSQAGKALRKLSNSRSVWIEFYSSH